MILCDFMVVICHFVLYDVEVPAKFSVVGQAFILGSISCTTATNIDSSVLTAGICFFTNNLPNLFALFNNVVGNSLVVVKLIKLQCKSYLFSNTN